MAEMGIEQRRYVGFWMRLLAMLIDTVIILVVAALVFAAVIGGIDPSRPEARQAGGTANLVFNVLVTIAVILFWRYRGATPGKMAISARIVDAETGGAPSTGKLIGRYFAYLVSTIPLGLGFLWVAFDKRKQGWHDKLAGTLVVYDRKK
jgi:uncharacterized RDD family membrane protein YckC